MKLRIRLISALLIAGVTIFTQTGCKEHTLIDAKVAPNIDNIHVFQTDTFTILTNTVYDPEVITSTSISGLPVVHGVGTINADMPVFGKTNAGIYMQVIPELLASSFIKDDVVDSAIMILPYAYNTYGDSTSAATPQSFSVYKITDQFSVDSTYYANQSLTYDPSVVYGSVTVSDFHALTNDSVFMDGFNRRPMLRINLNVTPSFPLYADLKAANDQSDIASFLSSFKGFYIGSTDTSKMNANSIPYFQLDGVDTYSRAGVLVYHHNSTTPGEQIFNYYFDIQSCAHYNKIIRNYSGTIAQQLFASKLRNDSVVLVQNQPGAAIDVQIPFLSNAFDGSKFKFIINNATLTITQINASPYVSPIYAPPTKLYAIGVGKNNGTDSLYSIADRYPVTSLYPLQFLDGYAKQATVGGVTTTRYTINMPREVMESITQKRVLHVRLNGTQDYPGATRLVAGGGAYSDPNYRIKLNIIYTKIQ
ncbi:MAG: hypothetical protein ACTHJ0_16475 [Flavipsychrobacter sp.]